MQVETGISGGYPSGSREVIEKRRDRRSTTTSQWRKAHPAHLPSVGFSVLQVATPTHKQTQEGLTLSDVTRFQPDTVKEVLLVGSDEEWLEVESMTECLVRISERDGSAGLPGFRITFTNGIVVGVTAKSIAGVKV